MDLDIRLKCHWHDFICENNMMCEKCTHQPADDDKPNGKKEPKPINWQTDYGDCIAPYCPSCGEMPYNLQRCVFCGQRFIQDERAKEWSKPPEVKRMDCFICGGKNTLEYTESRYNGHKHGECTACGMKFME